MFPNEGSVINDTNATVKTVMIRLLRVMGETDARSWEAQVFRAITGHNQDEVDWPVEDNQAGYYTWIKSFDRLITELEEDGYVQVIKNLDGTQTLRANDRV